MGKLNPWQAKNELSLQDLLYKMGFSPDHTTPNGEIWYLSPFRKNETEASFKICPKGTLPKYIMDVWYDHGEGTGGHIIDFIERYYGVTFAGAMQKLSEIVTTPAYIEPFRPAPPPPLPLLAPSTSIQDETIQPLGSSAKSVALRNYLYKRGIPLKIAKSYLMEIHYTYNGANYYALAFPSDTGGFELRNPYIKGSYKAKDISTIRPKSITKHAEKQVAVFEGFFDFLSYLVDNSLTEPDMPVVVLNSAAMTARAIDVIKAMGAETVHLYLDLDTTGKDRAEHFKQELQGINVLDHSHIYAGYKDYNEFLEANTQKSQSVSR